jgi:hypothetical protein
MTNRKIKFKISIKELSVEFEGDTLTAERIQEQVTGAINSLATAPNRLVGSGQEQYTSNIIDVSPARRRRRRRTKAAENGGEASPAEVEAVIGGEEGPARKATRRGEGQKQLITAFIATGFFGEPRTVGEIKEQLSKRGHSFKSNELSPSLGRLTREGILQRDKNDKQWVYFAAK